MSRPEPLAALIVALAAVFLVLTAALQAAIISVSRSRAHVYASRNGVDWQPLHQAIEERSNLLAALEATRSFAAVFATAFTLYAVLVHTGLHGSVVLLVAAVAAVLGTVLQAVPRVIVRQNPERWGPTLAPIAPIYRIVFGPAGWLFDLPGRLLIQALRIPSPTIAEEKPEEILRLVEIEESSGGIEEEERQMIRGVIGLEDTTAREIMVPRLDMAAVGEEQSIEDAVQVVVTRGFSRVPLYSGSIDNVTGIIYAKDILRYLANKQAPASLAELARKPIFIPETKRVDELLTELRQNKVHIAIVVDEYGGTAGLVTIEDLIEEIVGEIEDEYDKGEVTVERLSDNEAIVDARASVDVLNDLYRLDVEAAEVDTVGGLIYDQLGRIPAAGDEVALGNLTLTVLSVTGHRIQKVRIVRVAQPSTLVDSGG